MISGVISVLILVVSDMLITVYSGRLFSCVLFRKHESLSTYRDTNSARIIMMKDLKKVIEANPLFRGKLKFPNFRSQRLRRLINQRSATSSLQFIFFFSDELG